MDAIMEGTTSVDLCPSVIGTLWSMVIQREATDQVNDAAAS